MKNTSRYQFFAILFNIINLYFKGNKGAVTTRLQIYGCSVCFVNCHLAPHDNFVKERIDDYNSILQGQKFTVKDTTTILFHE